MHDTACLGLVHWDDPEGWYGEGGGRRVQDGEHMYTKKKKRSARNVIFSGRLSFLVMLRDSTLRRNMVEEQGIRTQETYISD